MSNLKKRKEMKKRSEIGSGIASKKTGMFFGLLLLALNVLLLPSNLYPQTARSLNNEGVDFYNEGKYSDAEVNFKKSLDKNYDSFIGHFNLGDALYKQHRYDEALREYKNALSYAKTKEEKAKVFHNVGNALLQSKKIKESIGAYASALKFNPNDMETKYNLSYALKLLKKQKNKNQNKQQNKNQKNKNKQKQKQNQNQNQKQKQQQQKKQQQQNQQQKKQQQLNKEQAKRILEALKNKEAKLQKKLRKRKSKRVVKKEKDW